MSTPWNRISFESLCHWSKLPLCSAHLSWLALLVLSEVPSSHCPHGDRLCYSAWYVHIQPPVWLHSSSHRYLEYLSSFTHHQSNSGWHSLLAVEEALTEQKRPSLQCHFQSECLPWLHVFCCYEYPDQKQLRVGVYIYGLRFLFKVHYWEKLKTGSEITISNQEQREEKMSDPCWDSVSFPLSGSAGDLLPRKCLPHNGLGCVTSTGHSDVSDLRLFSRVLVQSS